MRKAECGDKPHYFYITIKMLLSTSGALLIIPEFDLLLIF